MRNENYGPYADLLKTPGVISEQDVLHFRREVFQDGVVSQQEADAVFAMNDAIDKKCPAWNEFFIEVMTDFTVMQAEPRGYVSNDNAKWLVNRISHDGIVDSASELELLVRVISRAVDCPAALVQFALAQVAYAVVEGEGPLARSLQLTRGVIGEAEVELLRTILYAGAGCNGISISRQEAEILFDLNERTDAEKNHSDWQHLFVHATANYLMAVSGYKAPSRTEALARQEWLEDTEVDTRGLLGDVYSEMKNAFSEGFFDDIFTDAHVQMQKAWRERNERVEGEMRRAEAIDSDEAAWLVERIRRDGNMNSNEIALLNFLKKESPSLAPRMQGLLEEVA